MLLQLVGLAKGKSFSQTVEDVSVSVVYTSKVWCHFLYNSIHTTASYQSFLILHILREDLFALMLIMVFTCLYLFISIFQTYNYKFALCTMIKS